MTNQSSQPSLFAQLAGVVCQFKLGDRVYKKSGSAWHGFVVGFYSTKLTPVGVAVESEREPGSVQIYPVAALCLAVPQPSNALQSSLDLESQTTSEQSFTRIEDITNPDYWLKDSEPRENPQPKPDTSDEPKVNYSWKDILAAFNTRINTPPHEWLKDKLKPTTSEELVRIRLTTDNVGRIRVERFRQASDADMSINASGIWYCTYESMCKEWMTKGVLWLNGYNNSAYVEYSPEIVESTLSQVPGDFDSIFINLNAPGIIYTLHP